MHAAGQVQANHASNDQDQRNNFYPRERFPEKQNADIGNKSSAQPRPNCIGQAYLHLFSGDGQAAKAGHIKDQCIDGSTLLKPEEYFRAVVPATSNRIAIIIQSEGGGGGAGAASCFVAIALVGDSIRDALDPKK